jgi:hypothetical protein
MPSTYNREALPPESISVDGVTWTRKEVDTGLFQWSRPMRDEEYDWDPKKEDISLVGTDVPVRVVELQSLDGEWYVSGAETAGPEYHRPGFTEPIGPEFSESTDRFDEAVELVTDFVKKLS